MMKTGIYVEGRYFGANIAQARAFAKNRSSEHCRMVQIVYRNPKSNLLFRLETIDAGVRPIGSMVSL